jgi:hypothetical protein
MKNATIDIKVSLFDSAITASSDKENSDSVISSTWSADSDLQTLLYQNTYLDSEIVIHTDIDKCAI